MGARNILRLINEAFVQTTDNLDLDGNELVLDADADTSITADTDDQIDVKVGGSDTAVFYSTGFQNNGTETVDITAETKTISQGSRRVVVVSDSATDVIKLPAATVGDVINILVTGANCELEASDVAHHVNNTEMTSGVAAVLVNNGWYTATYYTANRWLLTGVDASAAAITIATPS
jgi:hypothetical protein